MGLVGSITLLPMVSGMLLPGADARLQPLLSTGSSNWFGLSPLNLRRSCNVYKHTFMQFAKPQGSIYFPNWESLLRPRQVDSVESVCAPLIICSPPGNIENRK